MSKFFPLYSKEKGGSLVYSRRRRLIKQLVFLLHQGEWENGSSAPGSAIKNSSYSLSLSLSSLASLSLDVGRVAGEPSLIWD